LGFGRSQVSDDIAEGIDTALPAPEARPHKEFTCKFADDQRSSSEDLRRKGRKRPRHKQPADKKRTSESPVRGNWKVDGTSEWQYPDDLVITEFSEFSNLDIFIYKKVKYIPSVI
jgi:hypothetical protein